MPINPYRSRLLKDYYRRNFAVVDTSLTSPDYFNIVTFPDEVGGGKNLISFLGNSSGLATGFDIDAEIIDADGNPIFYEFSPLTDRFGNRYLSFDVYDNTAPGLATIYLVGTTRNAPADPTGYNLIWARQILITPYKRNDSDLVFDRPAIVEVDQVLLPLTYKSSSLATSPITFTTSSQLSLTQANFAGFDKLEADDEGIVDSAIKGIAVSASATSTTVNAVNATFRSTDSGVDGGFKIGTWSKFNTIISSSTTFFNSGYIGATLEFDVRTGTASFQGTPQTQSYFSGSLLNTLDDYQAVVVDVIDSNRILVNKKLAIKGVTRQPNNRQASTTHIFESARGFTGSFYSRQNSTFTVTSSAISSSYLQFTFRDLRPIGGQVNNIKTYYKLSDSSTDFRLLNDQQVRPIEFLADPNFPNQTGYGADISDYRLIGHFTAQTIVDNYWLFGADLSNDTQEYTTGSIVYTRPQMDSILLSTNTSSYGLLYTRDYQTYIKNQTYTITFQATLDPNTELEVYMSSENTKPSVITDQNAPLAFYDATEFSKARTGETYSRFGKYLGKITNTTISQRYAGKVGFDFVPDEDGLGRPLFRLVTQATPGNAYLSKISITPTALAGFTPNLVQFALPADSDLLIGVTTQSIDLKFTYHDYTGQQSEYETFIPNVKLNFQPTAVGNGCAAEISRAWNFGFPFYAQAISGSNNGGATPGTVYSSSNLLGFGYPLPSQSAYGAVTHATIGGVPHTRSFWPLPYYDYEGNTPTAQRIDFARAIGVDSTNFGLAVGTSYSSFWNTRVPLYPSTFSTTPQVISHSATLVDNVQIDAAQGKITSSWVWTDPFYLRFIYTGSTRNGYINAFLNHGYKGVGRGPALDSSSITDIRFPDKGLIGITRTDISNSYASYSRNLGSNAANIRNRTEALKKRRLMWPVNGPYSASYFTENGGLYNVKFTLARSGSYSPDTGSFLSVYIFNANATLLTSSANLIEGYTGQVPPSQNIVKVGHLYNTNGAVSPAISWFNDFENTYYDRYDVNLVQWGSTGQLVFEPGYTTTSTYPFSASFGCFITDVSFCKLGVVTDPIFIKPFNFREV